MRRPLNCAFSTRFSSRRKAMTSRCSCASHPDSAATINCNGITLRIYPIRTSPEFPDTTVARRVRCGRHVHRPLRAECNGHPKGTTESSCAAGWRELCAVDARPDAGSTQRIPLEPPSTMAEPHRAQAGSRTAQPPSEREGILDVKHGDRLPVSRGYRVASPPESHARSKVTIHRGVHV
jgi:hypothetical protein